MDMLTRILSNLVLDASVVGGILFLFAIGFAVRRIRRLRREEQQKETQQPE